MKNEILYDAEISDNETHNNELEVETDENLRLGRIEIEFNSYKGVEKECHPSMMTPNEFATNVRHVFTATAKW